MQFALGDGKLLFRIKNDDIGILADGDFAFVFKPNIRAVPEDSTSTMRSRLMRPLTTPSECSRIIRVSIPGAPLGIFL